MGNLGQRWATKNPQSLTLCGFLGNAGQTLEFLWCRREESNPRPSHYESDFVWQALVILHEPLGRRSVATW
ncbi:hypothetical protein CBM2587_A80003 [Cupriavidus taiwanensis]|uniref:Uncharacterized protein n=1 Tax=Cupriavidus taiwanensis TaxID=164546 RepID=A0A375BWJ4_9BURK|nr:hypothetical protein CBM2587_A80003 [Cupriavidus taiwanensis]